MKIEHVEIKKHISVFALSLFIIHRLIFIMSNNEGPITTRTCVEKEDGIYICTEDTKEPPRQKGKKSKKNYDFGVKQTIAGSMKETQRMNKLAAEIELYLKKFMEGDSEEWMKEQCNNKHKNCMFWSSSGECESNPVSNISLIDLSILCIFSVG